VVQPLHSVAILSQVEGVLTHVHFKEGDDVEAGALLVTLDQRPFKTALLAAQAQLAEARANSEKAAADLDRYAKLHDKKAISDSDFSQYSAVATGAEASVAVQQAAVATAKLNLDYTEIRAPIAGRTGRLTFREGSLVRPNDATQPLLTINQLAPIGVSFSLPEADLGPVQRSLKKGPVTVRATVPSDDNRALSGELDYIDNTVGLTTGTIALRAKFKNDDGALWPGQFVNITLKLDELVDALVVPGTAVVDGQQGSQIFVVRPDKTIEVRHINPGILDGNDIVIDGAKPGETVVIDGQLRLMAGSKVSIRPPEETATSTAPVAPAKKKTAQSSKP
jgi:multidrug efflux system membrane fusion protein